MYTDTVAQTTLKVRTAGYSSSKNGVVANFLTKDGCRIRCFSHQHSTSNVERSAHLGQHTWECHVCLRMPEMDN